MDIHAAYEGSDNVTQKSVHILLIDVKPEEMLIIHDGSLINSPKEFI
jgi:hypothetical protein